MLCRSITLRVHGAVSICLLRCEKKEEEEEEPVAHIGSLSIQHYIHILNNRLKKKRTNERKSRAAKQHHLLSRCFPLLGLSGPSVFCCCCRSREFLIASLVARNPDGFLTLRLYRQQDKIHMGGGGPFGVYFAGV